VEFVDKVDVMVEEVVIDVVDELVDVLEAV
jgi:hypothetical protein